MVKKEGSELSKFTTPSELHKAVNTLRGIVAGITLDGASDREMEELINWCVLHKHLETRHPFNELIPLIYSAQQDGVIDAEETQDILWLCNNFLTDQSYYDEITCALQYLAGILHGVLADGELTDKEVSVLYEWVTLHHYLRGCYPFDEIESLLAAVLEDRKIDPNEREMLVAFFSQFVDLAKSINIDEAEIIQLKDKYSITGICAINPVIEFPGCQFCFTGISGRDSRVGIARLVEEQGGIYVDTVSRQTDYLIVGSAGNPCWAYACYGRKIEEAVELRKQGHKLVIVNENDFWNALEQ